MKLIRFKLNEDFRGLQKGFELIFFNPESKNNPTDFMPYCFVGENGSGKSNIMEALASIFYHLECIYLGTKPNDFERTEENPKGFDSRKCSPDEFELEYFIKLDKNRKETLDISPNISVSENSARVKITKIKDKAPKTEWLNRSVFISENTDELSAKMIKALLPDFVIGYSSGQNEILSLPFFKMRFLHYDEYEENLITEPNYSVPGGSLIYLDSQYSQAVFLCNYLLQDKKHTKPIHEVLKIKEINEFRLIIKTGQMISNDQSRKILEEKEKKQNYKEYQLIGNLNRKIERLKNCCTSFYESADGDLYLDYYVTEETIEAFRRNFFNNPLELFQLFQVLFTLNLFHIEKDVKQRVYNSSNLYIHDDVLPVLYDEKRIIRFKDFKIKRDGIFEPIFTKALSDGEHQFLHSMGVCILFKEKNVLFLLDEPETHFNPEWRSKFISTLKDCLLGTQKSDEVPANVTVTSPEKKHQGESEILITSHSPFIVSDCRKENVFIFKNGKAENPKINTFGTSVSILTEEIFNKSESISKLGEEEIERIKKLPMETEEQIQNAKEESRSVGESVEKVLLFREILLKEEKIKKDNDTKL